MQQKTHQKRRRGEKQNWYRKGGPQTNKCTTSDRSARRQHALLLHLTIYFRALESPWGWGRSLKAGGGRGRDGESQLGREVNSQTFQKVAAALTGHGKLFCCRDQSRAERGEPIGGRRARRPSGRHSLFLNRPPSPALDCRLHISLFSAPSFWN